MFDIGFTEILLIGIVALIVIGPEKLPTAIRTGLRYFRQLKSGVSSIRDEVERELSIDELRKDIVSGKEKITQEIGYDELNESINELKGEANYLSGDYGGWDDDDDGEVSDSEIEADLAILAGETGPQLPSGDAESITGAEVTNPSPNTVAKKNQSKDNDAQQLTSITSDTSKEESHQSKKNKNKQKIKNKINNVKPEKSK